MTPVDAERELKASLLIFDRNFRAIARRTLMKD
jgi:hypothetical protein